MTMNNELSPYLELAPYLADRDGHLWKRVDGGYLCRNAMPPVRYATLVRGAGPLTPLWSSPAPTPNNDILPDLSTWHEVPVGAVVPAGVACVLLWKDGSISTNRPMSVDSTPHRSGGIRRFTAEPIPAPDPDAEWVDAIVKADSPEVARALLGTIRGEQR